MDFPAGYACDFRLQVEGFGQTKDPMELPAKDDAVRILSAGKGWDLVFTNLATIATYSLKGNGAASQTTTFADGTQTLEMDGHNVVFMFPTDNPPGPSTVLYTGRVVITVDANGVWTMTKSSGRALDICQALSG